MAELYSLRRANRSVKLAVVLFLVTLGAAYLFAFLMVRTYAGLTPAAVAAAYAPSAAVPSGPSGGPTTLHTEPLDLSSMTERVHTVDTNLLIQDSHVHLPIYAVVAALETLVVLGLEWPMWLGDAVIATAFASGLLDFVGQWMMNAGYSGFAVLTIGSGWAMAIVYLVVVVGVATALARSAPPVHAGRNP